MAKILLHKKVSDGAVSTEVAFVTLRKPLTELVKQVGFEWSLSPKQSLELLQSVLKNAKPGDFLGRTIDKE